MIEQLLMPGYAGQPRGQPAGHQAYPAGERLLFGHLVPEGINGSVDQRQVDTVIRELAGRHAKNMLDGRWIKHHAEERLLVGKLELNGRGVVPVEAAAGHQNKLPAELRVDVRCFVEAEDDL